MNKEKRREEKRREEKEGKREALISLP